MKTFLLTILLASSAMAKIETKMIEYKEGTTVLEGYIAYDTKTGKKPGIVIVHDWMGLRDFAKKKAEQLAQMGYVAFAADIYGKGNRPTSPKEAGEFAGKYKKDRSLLRARVNAALEELKKQKNVETTK